ncbi:ATP-binding protein [Thalassotalea montiporae]
MKLTISQKLQASLLGLTLLILVATLGLARWSFERGFLDYINALELQRLTQIADQLALEYADNNDQWQGLSKQRFERILRQAHRPGDMSAPPPPKGHRPPPHRMPKHGRDHSPIEPQREPSHGRLGPPTALFDNGGRHLMGTPFWDDITEFFTMPVMVDGQQVGLIKSAPRRHFETAQETEFSRQQLTTSMIIAVVCLVIAFFVSRWMANLLLAPIKRTIDGVAKISAGDYQTRLNEQRNDEIGELMQNLDRFALSLDEGRSARQRWLADISHELRTPVTVLTGEIEALKDGIRPFDHTQLLSLEQEITRLRHLIEDLYELSVSDIGGLNYQFSELNISDQVAQAVGMLRQQLQDTGLDISLAAEPNIVISGDSRRLNQLMTNLLNNSRAYTDAPGKLAIQVSRQANFAEISIEDSEPGVALEDCEKLFEPLFRLEASRSRRTAGAGLGLAICRNIVEAHQGTITAQPSALGGLSVVVKLPLTGNTNV